MRRAVSLLLVLAACGGSEDGGSDAAGGAEERATSVELPASISNHGGDLEGHGPRGFAGQGVGLFAGDELNANFPVDDGIQIWLTFDVSPVDTFQSAVLRSDALSVRGNPFEALGELRVERVEYSAFEPESFDLPASSELGLCAVDVEAGTFECDVTELLEAATEADAELLQLRLKFDELSDGDGEPDLALFFLSDSNTNESGIFTLDLS